MEPSTNKYITIIGIVLPTQWDRRGNILQVAIQTDSFEKYLVEVEHNKELLKMIDQKIHICGSIIGEDITGLKIIKIKSINN